MLKRCPICHSAPIIFKIVTDTPELWCFTCKDFILAKGETYQEARDNWNNKVEEARKSWTSKRKSKKDSLETRIRT